MLCIQGSPLYQWDKNRQVKIDSIDITTEFTIQCCHENDEKALVVEPSIVDDAILAPIPNILMQRSGTLQMYVVVDGDTIYNTYFYVIPRPKPDDYIYEETEVLSITSAVNKALEKAKNNGEFTPKRGIDYWNEADIAEIQGYIDKQIAPVEETLRMINEGGIE